MIIIDEEKLVKFKKSPIKNSANQVIGYMNFLL